MGVAGPLGLGWARRELRLIERANDGWERRPTASEIVGRCHDDGRLLKRVQYVLFWQHGLHANAGDDVSWRPGG
jgi:hypothetical protein